MTELPLKLSTSYEFDNPFVYWTEVNNHKTIKDSLVPTIKSLSESDTNTVTVDGSISSYYHQTYPYINKSMLTDIVYNPVQQMMEERGFDKPKKLEIDGFWWNNYEAGGKTQVHKHSSGDWSGIYLLHLEEPNTTTFIAQYGEASNSNFMNQNKTIDFLSEGYVMIFPSFLLHYAQPSIKNRIVISFDVICHYKKIPLMLQHNIQEVN